MGRLTIFAKGNLDVRDSLHSLRLGGDLAWNGVNEIVRARHAGSTARVRHETWTRSDALLAANGVVPAQIATRALALGAYPAPSQVSTAVFEAAADVVVLSIQPDLHNNLLRHRRDGYLFYPDGWRGWPAEDQAWLRAEFAPEPLLDVGQSMANLEAIIGRIRAGSDAPILVYNASAVAPGEQVHTHEGLGDILSTRVRRFNVGLIDVSQRTGVSIVDVDRIIARHGADRLKLDALHLTAEACRLVAEEVVRIVEDYGCFAGGGPMRVSVVVRSKDEAPRLRLTLSSLARQSARCEVVVVNDGSSDHTPAVLAEAASWLDLRVVSHATPRGRSGAANAGAKAASGDIVLFLDGDTLADPEFVAAHQAAHEGARGVAARGELWHLRGTRFLHDPETGAARAGEEARIARLSPAELARLMVTRAQVLEDFGAVRRRAEAGIYPGAGPRALQALELQALRENADCPALWAAASGSNFSAPREAFLDVGGFDERIDINEHRELALRLCRAGLAMAPADGARVYHLTHRSGWRDPLEEGGWEAAFYDRHPERAVKLLAVLWASLSPQCVLPPEERIDTLPALAAAAQNWTEARCDEIRRRLGLQNLAAETTQGAA